MSNLTERINNYIIKYHELHETSYKNPDAANRQLSGIGATRIKTHKVPAGTERVYEHPELGTFTTIQKPKQTKLYHWPMPQEMRERHQVPLKRGEKPPTGKVPIKSGKRSYYIPY